MEAELVILGSLEWPQMIRGANVVALHPALPRHLADVALGAAGELGEVAALERLDRLALGIGECGGRLGRLRGR